MTLVTLTYPVPGSLLPVPVLEIQNLTPGP